VDGRPINKKAKTFKQLLSAGMLMAPTFCDNNAVLMVAFMQQMPILSIMYRLLNVLWLTAPHHRGNKHC
jgi:hypothetical protein